LVLFFSFACSVEKKTNEIFVEISPEKLTLDQKNIQKDDFEKQLKIVIDKKKSDGFKREELIINLNVDKRTRRGDIADIETALRRLNVRRVNYSTLGEEQTSDSTQIEVDRLLLIHPVSGKLKDYRR